MIKVEIRNKASNIVTHINRGCVDQLAAEAWVAAESQKVTDYAAARINQINAYGVYRMKRIKQFRDEKTALLGG